MSTSFEDLDRFEQRGLVAVFRNLFAELQEHDLGRARDGLSQLLEQLTETVGMDPSLTNLRESGTVLDETSLLEEGLECIQILLNHHPALAHAVAPLLPP